MTLGMYLHNFSTGYDTKSILKRKKTDSNPELSFSKTSCSTKLKGPTYTTILVKR